MSLQIITNQHGFRLIIIVAIAFAALGVNRVYAAAENICPTGQTDIMGLKFTPRSLAFYDSDGINYTAGDIIIPESETYSAAYRTQLIQQFEIRKAGFSKFINHKMDLVLTKPDRYGRMVVNVFAGADQQWLQWELVNAGLALVNPQGTNLSCIKQLLAVEAVARSNNVGIWQFSDIVMSSEDVNWSKRVQSYQLVEGIIASVGKTSSKFYLNFGDNWSEDFTVIVAKPYFRRFKKVYGDLKQLAGKKVRIRGWMIQNRGPMIEIYHPGQIEVDIK